MNAQERFRRVDALFRAASALPAEAREAYLAAECCGETSILMQVRSLLTADQRADDVLDRPALVPVSGALPDEADPGDAVPRQIGRYRIVRKIGEGGMGSVFEAEQENPRRRVALKLLRSAGGGRRLVQRFQREVQILGRLGHPGIAQILEAGSIGEGADARPYFVMELVRGVSLIEHARAQHLGIRERLGLFALVCDAVQFAHQNGVVHRDLKPANILVVAEGPGFAGPGAGVTGQTGAGTLGTERRTVNQRKVLDFGVARLTDSDLATVTQHTTAGELVGTVPYMSPEQAAGDPAQLDWRSDVYSLGVILYELLTARLPHDVRRLLVHEAVRVIREDDPTPAGSIDRSLRGDLETILSKALDKDRLRRYQSAAELAADIRRHLSEQPIAARPASVLYRIAKFTRRNKAVVGGVVFAFAALAGGTGVAVRQAIVAEQARAREERLRTDAQRQSYHACLVAASSALRRQEIAEAERHLEAAPAHLRAWEWAHLHSRLDDSLGARRTGLAATCVAISPDGSLVVACDSAGRIRLWRAADWSVAAEVALEGTVGQRRIEQLVFSPDGRELRVDTRAGSLRFHAETLALIEREERVAWRRSPDGRIALSERKTDPGMVVWQYPSGQELFQVECRAPRESVLCFSPAGDLLAVCLPRERGLIVLRVADGTPVCHVPELRAVTKLSFSTDGTCLGVALMTGSARVVELPSGASTMALEGHETSIVAIGFSPSGDRIATASDNGVVRLWDAQSGQLLTAMRGQRSAALLLAFSQDGATLVTATSGDVRWWDGRASSDPFVLRAPQSVYGVAYSPDGALLAAAALGGDRPLRLWDVESGREAFAGLDGFPSSLAFDRGGKRLAVGRSADNASTLLVSVDGSPLKSFAGHFWRTDWVGFSADGERLLSLGNSGRLVEYSIATGARVRQERFPGNEDQEGCRAAFSPDGALLAVAARRELRLLEASSWEALGTLDGHSGSIYALAFSANGRYLASGASDRTLRVWDVQTHAPIAVMTGHTDEILAAAFSPDGTRIVSGGRDRVIRVWDAEHYDEITQLHGHASYVYCLAFSPDGRTLVSGGGDETVRLWDVRPYRDRRPR